MLKFFFWILLLANGGLLAYQLGYFDGLVSNGREPTRLGNQLNAQYLRLIPPPVPEPLTSPAPEPVAVAPIGTVLACAEFGAFNPEEAGRFSARLAALSLGERVSRRSVREITSHMVYIPSMGDREGAENKAAELRQLGVSDFFIIQNEGSLRWGISLGVFKQEEAARTHLARLRAQGVRSARIGARSSPSNLVAFQLRELDAGARAAVEQIRKAFPKQEMRDCTAA
jgi:hypothetical protein